MEVLHILRSKPDDITETFIEAISGSEAERFSLYQGDVDWDRFIDEIFEFDQVICWW